VETEESNPWNAVSNFHSVCLKLYESIDSSEKHLG
jgi:hypothetical protein